MKSFKNILFLFISSLIISSLLFSKNFAENNKFSLIKLFCLKNVKAEITKNDLKYSNNLGEAVCNCYLDKISKNMSHQSSIAQCKIENKKKINI